MVNPNVTRSSRPLWRRALVISLQVFIGLGIGAGIGEYAFSRRADGAFPHVNFYVVDPDLGVRLEPGASMRFQLRDNPLTTIHVNGAGHRGGEWPAPADDEVIVVGDSQVFGLGVEDDATFSAGLAARTGRTVINGGVPTYGPQEYLATARELLTRRRAKTVVVVLNFVNDPFELGRPNRERHAVWDGWAVRIETAPAHVTEFPGRKFLFSRSHAVYALRRWLHERGTVAAPDDPELGAVIDPGTPSEGNLQELVLASQRAHADLVVAQDEARRSIKDSEQKLQDLGRELANSDERLKSLVEDHVLARGRPGDIVEEYLSESGREVRLTATMLHKIANARGQYIQALLRDRDAADDAKSARDLLASQDTLADQRQQLRARIAAGVPELPRPPSIFRDYLRTFKTLCDEHGAELVVVALPIDVQVDPAEWAKYGVTDPPDMQESLILLADLVADADQLGVRALDATVALRAAEPGAFLDHDIHMTAKGHAAVAEALQTTLATPFAIPLQLPKPGLPEGTSFVPAVDEWGTRGEVKVTGSSAAGCSTQIQHGWLRVQCSRKKPRDSFDAIVVREGATPATMALRSEDGLSLVTPLTIGRPISARFYKKTGVQDLEIRWPVGADGKPKFTGVFVDVPAEPAPAEPDAAAAATLCACHRLHTDEQLCSETADPDELSACKETCGQLWGDVRLLAACSVGTEDCARKLACVQNDPLAAPTCPAGQLHAFASNACFTACDPAHACAQGTCTPWQAGGVCV